MLYEVITIAKKERSIYDPLYKELEKMISRFAVVEDIELVITSYSIHYTKLYDRVKADSFRGIKSRH